MRTPIMIPATAPPETPSEEEEEEDVEGAKMVVVAVAD